MLQRGKCWDQNVVHSSLEDGGPLGVLAGFYGNCPKLCKRFGASKWPNCKAIETHRPARSSPSRFIMSIFGRAEELTSEVISQALLPNLTARFMRTRGYRGKRDRENQAGSRPQTSLRGLV